jgi:PAS domain S-box-containing protein
LCAQNDFANQARTAILPDRLSELENLYREAPVGLCLLDLDLQYVRINSWLARLNGKPADEHIGRSIHEIIPDIAPQVDRFCRRVIDTGGPVLDVPVQGKTPRGPGLLVTYLLASFYPLLASDGKVVGVSIVAQDITSLKQAELLLLREKRVTESVIESMPGLFFLVDEDLRLQRWNKYAEILLGLSADELANRNAVELVLPDSRPRVAAAFARAFREGYGSTELALRSRDGRRRQFLGQGARVRIANADYVCGLVLDITDRKQAEEALRESEAKYRLLVENSHAGVVVHAPDSSIVFHNQRAAELLGVKSEVIPGKTAADSAWSFFKEDNTPVRPEDYPVNKVIATRRPLKEMVAGINRPSQGDRVWVLVNAYPEFNDRSELQDVVVTFIDITERKQAEEALAERYRFEKSVADFSASLVNVPSHRLDKKIEDGLGMIIKTLGLDRATLTAFSPDRRSSYPTHTFAAPGISPLPSDQDLMREFPRISEKLLRGETVRLARLADAPAELKSELQGLMVSGVQSVLAMPLVAGGAILGIFGLSSFRNEQTWPEDMVRRLQMLGQIFANALARRQADESLRHAFAEIKKLKEKVEAECFYLSEEIKLEHNFGEIVGNSDALKSVLRKVEQVAPTTATVLVLGETGTGKELVARAIHGTSPRRARPLVKVDCTALPPDLIESELFGHEKGAFTGAYARQIGRFEIANASTIFLDEIGELPPSLQVKLLRVLQDGEFERLGGSRTIKIDVRVIAATNRDLEAEVRIGRFREDLWYRLNVFPVKVPPLRERKEDLPLLVQHFVKRFAKRLGKTIEAIPQNVLDILQNYPWPGNVRELENVIERAVINTQGGQLRLADQFERPWQRLPSRGGQRSLEEIERDHIVKTLEEAGWKIAGTDGAAAILGLNPSTLRGRMRKLGIRRP